MEVGGEMEITIITGLLAEGDMNIESRHWPAILLLVKVERTCGFT